MKKKILTSIFAALTVASMVFAAGCSQAIPVANAAAANPNVKTALMAAAAGDTTGSTSTGISVSGTGTITIKPDTAIFTLGVETDATEAGAARKANDEKMAKVLAALKTAGVADADITTTAFNIYPRYDEKGVKVTSYTVSNNVQVKVKNLDKLGDVLAAATTAGANTAGGISFDVADRTAAYNQALAQAMDKAKARADVISKATGVKLGAVLTINETSSYSGPVYAAAESVKGGIAAAADSVPVQSGQLDITASVSVVYDIAK